MELHRAAGAILIALLLLPGCRSGDVSTEPGGAQRPAPELALWELPGDWLEVAPGAFEALFPAERRRSGGRLSESALGQVAAALAQGAERATRAVLVAAWSGDPAAAEVLLARLEARAPAPGRAEDAGDALAAAALGQRLAGDGVAERLVALAVGATPHPDLEVRVECAAAAFWIDPKGVGRPAAGFLVRVLLLDTEEGRRRGEAPPAAHPTGWARWRASEVLSRGLGVENPYRPDASPAERERAALLLESALP